MTHAFEGIIGLAVDRQLKTGAQRETWGDVARGIGIAAVVAGHTFAPDSNTTLWIFSFHMPLFFILSGYFLSLNVDLQTFALRRARALLVPYIVTIAIYLAYTIALFGVPGGIKLWPASIAYASGNVVPHLPQILPIGPMWFMPSLFAASLIAYGIQKTRLAVPAIMLAVVIGIRIGKHTFLPFSLDIALVVQIFVFFGLAARREALIHSMKWPILALCAMALVIERYDVVTSLNNRDYRDFIVQAVGAIGGSILVVRASIIIARHELFAAPLAYVGRAAIVILCFHLFDTGYGQFNRVPGFHVIEANLWLQVAFRIAFPLALYEIFRRVPPLRWCYGLTKLSASSFNLTRSSCAESTH